jgi:hypothetical protein
MLTRLADRYVPELQAAIISGRLSQLGHIEVAPGMSVPASLVVRWKLAQLDHLIDLRQGGVHVASARWEAVADDLLRLHKLAFPDD